MQSHASCSLHVNLNADADVNYMKGIKQASPPPPNFFFSRDIMLFFDEKIITSQDAGIFSSITAVLLSVMDGLVYKPGV